MTNNKNPGVAIVTGAASGIGKATAEILAAEGKQVIVADIREEKTRAAADSIGENVVYHYLDVSDEQCWIDIMAFASKEFGGLDILVNNAGVPHFASIEDATWEDWERVFKINAGGVFLGCKYALQHMKEKGGSIVNVSSFSSVVGVQRSPVYASSKGAINALTRTITAHIRHNNLPVRCNAVLPGGTRSDMALENVEEHYGEGTAETKAIMESLSPPEHIASAIAFLCSPSAAGINGVDLLVDDGEAFTFHV